MISWSNSQAELNQFSLRLKTDFDDIIPTFIGLYVKIYYFKIAHSLCYLLLVLDGFAFEICVIAQRIPLCMGHIVCSNKLAVCVIGRYL